MEAKKAKKNFAEGTETTLGKVILCRGPNSDPRQNRRQVKTVCLPSQVADGLSLPTAGPLAKSPVAESNYLPTAWPSANMVLPTAYRCRGPTLGKPFFAESPTFGSRQRRWLLATGLFRVVKHCQIDRTLPGLELRLPASKPLSRDNSSTQDAVVVEESFENELTH